MKIIIIAFISLLFISCASEPLSDPTPKDKLIYPVTLAISKDGNRLFVANSNFDLRYRGASIVVIDLKTQKIIPEETKILDSFLSDMETDEDENLLFVVSKDSAKLYAYNVSDSSPYLSCNEYENGKCDVKNILQLSFDSPESMTIDKTRKLIYITHKSGPNVSIVKYEKKDGVLSLRLLKSFTVKDLTGRASAIKYNKSLDRVFVTSDHTKYVVSFKPLMDYYGNINKLKYFPLIKVTNRALLLNSYSQVEDISFFEDKMFLSMSNPSSISILTKQKSDNGDDVFSFDKSIYTDYFPVKTLCTDSGVCLTSLYESKKLAVLDVNNGLLLSNLNIEKRGYDMIYSKTKKEVYITLFIDNSIMVLDLDPNSSTFLQIKNLIY